MADESRKLIYIETLVVYETDSGTYVRFMESLVSFASKSMVCTIL